MLDPRKWARLEGLMLIAQALGEEAYAGGHASLRSGAGTEFQDHRPYVPGDDPGAIDWKLFGRTDRHHVRRYRWETDLRVQLAIDTSASMDFAALEGDGTGPSKWRVSQELAAAFAFLAVRQADRVGLALLGDGLHGSLPVRGTWAHLQSVCATLERTAPAGEADLGWGLARLERTMSRRGLVMLLTDALDEPAGLFDGLSRLRHRGCAVTVFQVLTPAELNLAPSPQPRLALRDPERRHQVTTHVPQVASRYRQLIHEHVDRIRRGCAARGVHHERVRTDRPVVEMLRRGLSRGDAGHPAQPPPRRR